MSKQVCRHTGALFVTDCNAWNSKSPFSPSAHAITTKGRVALNEILTLTHQLKKTLPKFKTEKISVS